MSGNPRQPSSAEQLWGFGQYMNFRRDRQSRPRNSRETPSSPQRTNTNEPPGQTPGTDSNTKVVDGIYAPAWLPYLSDAGKPLPGVEFKVNCNICWDFIPIIGDNWQEDHRSDHLGKMLPCGHVFGDSCITNWLETNDTCPECRQKLAMPQGCRHIHGRYFWRKLYRDLANLRSEIEEFLSWVENPRCEHCEEGASQRRHRRQPHRQPAFGSPFDRPPMMQAELFRQLNQFTQLGQLVQFGQLGQLHEHFMARDNTQGSRRGEGNRRDGRQR
ncbi:hypothetical protein GGR57DRAFT_512002 [Xylariaceae sp. FL1272]|nr:hypothetical protein GGR57DRAFT_512002 [Xylariaceae sp. FL1272]